MARQVASLYGVLSLNDSDYRTRLQQNQQNTQSFGTQLTRMGGQLQSMGAGLTAVMAPVGLALGASVNTAREFNRNMSNVNAILGITGTEASNLSDDILAFGSATVAGPMAVSEAYYSIVSGVQDASTHMAILEAATRTSEAGQADLMATTSGLISTMNSYGFAADDAAFVSDVFSRTVQMGVLTMDELAASMPQVTGLAAQFGIGMDEVGGSLAYLTTQGYSASQSATYMRSMMTTLLAPTTAVSEAIAALGYDSGAALLEAEGLVGAYQLLSEQNNGLDGLITNQEALMGALGLTQEQASEFLETYTTGIDGATERAGAIQDETEAWSILTSQLQGLSIQIGSALLPVLSSLITNHITPAIAAVSAWITENPELTGQIVMLTGALVMAGPVIMGVGTLISMAGTGFAFAAGAVGLLLGPAGLLIFTIAGLVGWLNSREGGLIGSLNEARIAAQQLAFLGLFVLNSWVNTVNNSVEALGLNVDDVRNDILNLIDTIADLDTNFNNTVNNATGFNLGNAPSQAADLALNATPFGPVLNSAEAVAQGVRALLGFGGARAMGGPVTTGRSYLVGEEGPEMFVPSSAGSIVPNGALGGGGQQMVINFNGTINANSEGEGRAAARGFSEELTDLMRSRGVGTVSG